MYHANIVRDSVYIETYAKNDTIYRDRWHRTIINDTVLKHDTLYVSKVDTVKVPVPVEEKKSWLERNILTPVNNLLWGVGVLLCAIVLWWGVRKFKNKTS